MENLNKRVLFINGAFNIFTNYNIYKIEIKFNTVRKDINNRKIVFNNDYNIISKIDILSEFPLCFKSKLLKPPKKSDDAVIYVLEKLFDMGEKSKINILKFKYILLGLTTLYAFSIPKSIIEKIIYILEYESSDALLSVGPVHGDLHAKNILIGEQGTPVMIDFDCSRKYDIQAMDALYYIIEREREGTSLNWLQQWIKIVERPSIIEKKYPIIALKYIDINIKLGLLIFFIERIGQEKELGVNLNPQMIKQILKEYFVYY